MIYLVEDDESIRELVVYTLKSQGMDAKGFERPSLFWKELEKEVPALILLDIMLPEEDGISILRKLRTRPDTRSRDRHFLFQPEELPQRGRTWLCQMGRCPADL